MNTGGGALASVAPAWTSATNAAGVISRATDQLGASASKWVDEGSPVLVANS
jgi:hypothetical protein